MAVENNENAVAEAVHTARTEKEMFYDSLVAAKDAVMSLGAFADDFRERDKFWKWVRKRKKGVDCFKSWSMKLYRINETLQKKLEGIPGAGVFDRKSTELREDLGELRDDSLRIGFYVKVGSFYARIGMARACTGDREFRINDMRKEYEDFSEIVAQRYDWKRTTREAREELAQKLDRLSKISVPVVTSHEPKKWEYRNPYVNYGPEPKREGFELPTWCKDEQRRLTIGDFLHFDDNGVVNVPRDSIVSAAVMHIVEDEIDFKLDEDFFQRFGVEETMEREDSDSIRQVCRNTLLDRMKLALYGANDPIFFIDDDFYFRAERVGLEGMKDYFYIDRHGKVSGDPKMLSMEITVQQEKNYPLHAFPHWQYREVVKKILDEEFF
ncbi:hypothetical protein KY336_04340 [Candidatus Woesearchaeota archaeon]|nr:hypothetical protein [Candidatus Woesearchaeota archaeon]